MIEGKHRVMKHGTSEPNRAADLKELRTGIAEAEDGLRVIGDGGLDTVALRAIIERAVKDAVSDGKPFDIELKFMTANGNVQCVHATGRADREQVNYLARLRTSRNTSRLRMRSHHLKSSSKRSLTLQRTAFCWRKPIPEDFEPPIVQSAGCSGIARTRCLT